MKAKLLIESNNILGEGPIWDAHRKELLWVDIEQKQLNFLTPHLGDSSSHLMPERIGAAAPIFSNEDGMYCVALQNGMHYYNRVSNGLTFICNPENHLPQNRFNDGKYDSKGRYWVGTMHLEAKINAGSLYKINSDGKPHKMLKNLTIANGLGWSPDNKYMYFIDTLTSTITCYDFDETNGEISHPNPIITVPEVDGYPDGMCVDTKGMLWVAHWGGAMVTQWDPTTGRQLQKIEIPCPHVTSCCIGGENMDILYITTARYGLSDVQLEEFPHSGSVFYISI